jgi:hypothetical protein
MIGYHYTTKESWERIQYEGMEPSVMNALEWEIYASIVQGLPREAIWVWQEPLNDRDAWIVTAGLAVSHGSFELVLLQIEYSIDEAASYVCNPCNDDSVFRLRCHFGAGRMRTPNLLIELLVNRIQPKNIELIWETDLLSSVSGRHDACLI